MNMTTRSDKKSRLPKSAVALLVVAMVFAAGGAIRSIGLASAAALPEPEQMAILAIDRKSTQEIVDLWAESTAQQPTNAAFHTAYASAMMNLAGTTGDLTLYENAEAVARTAVELDPENETANLTLAAALSGQHDFLAARSIIETVITRDSTSTTALLALGDVHVELGNYETADDSYTKAMSELGEQPPALMSRQARLDSIRGDSLRSVELARLALQGAGDIDLRPADAAFYWSQFGHYSFLTGDLNEAESAIRSALIVDPDNLGSAELLAKVLAARGKDSEAIATYQTLIERGPAADLHGELAKLYNRAGRDDEADIEIAKGLELARIQADRFPAERRHLISFLADHGPEDALRLAELDLASRDDVTSHAWYAWALLQTNQPEAALIALGPALETGTDDPLFLYQAGAIHAANGSNDRAAEYLTEALEVNDAFDVEHSARAKALLAELQS